MNTAAHAERGDGKPAESWGHGNRHSFEDRLHGEAERATVPRERIANDGEQRRTGHARPRHDEDKPHEDERPRGRRPVESVADRRECDEKQEGAAPAVAIADPPAWVLVDAVEEVFARPEEADRSDRRAEALEVLRQKALPEVLAEREQEDRRGDGDDVEFE